jgi:predicted nucleic acid-binding Zn ribbon protein
MDHMIKSLPAIVRAGGQSPVVVEASVIAAWNHIAGEQLRKQAVATSLNGKTLLVAVADSIWQKQMEGMRSQLLFRLKSVLGEPLVSRLEFRVDAKVVPRAQPRKKAESKETTEKDVSLELWSAASSIRDKNLRRTFLAAAASNLRAREG